MDILSSILNSMEKQSGVKNEELSSDSQKEQSSVICNVCGELVPKANLLSHKLSHIQGSGKKDESKIPSESDNTGHSNKKPSYKCPVCGKIYTERKTFAAHKNNHKRNQKFKESGVHLFDKEGCLKLKASATDKAMSSFEITAANGKNSNLETKLPVKTMINTDVTMTGNNSKLETKLPVRMINPDVTARPVSGNIFKLETALPVRLANNPDVTANPVSGNIFKFETALPVRLANNPDLTANPVSGNIFKLETALPVRLANNPDVTANPFSGNNSKFETKLPVKLMINPDVTANPMSCAADWEPPEPAKPYVDVAPMLLESSLQIPKNPPEQISTEIRRDPPEITSFKCKICGRNFTKRKTFLNHKDNHKRNKDHQKLLFYGRSKEAKKEALKFSTKKN